MMPKGLDWVQLADLRFLENHERHPRPVTQSTVFFPCVPTIMHCFGSNISTEKKDDHYLKL